MSPIETDKYFRELEALKTQKDILRLKDEEMENPRRDRWAASINSEYTIHAAVLSFLGIIFALLFSDALAILKMLSGLAEFYFAIFLTLDAIFILVGLLAVSFRASNQRKIFSHEIKGGAGSSNLNSRDNNLFWAYCVSLFVVVTSTMFIFIGAIFTFLR